MKLPLLFLLMSPPRYVPERGERERERGVEGQGGVE